MTNPDESTGSPDRQLCQRIDVLLSHVWMVRTFLRHSEEAEEDDELQEVHRGLYDYMLALGPPFEASEWSRYLKLARKKIRKLRAASELYTAIQPEISSHTSFKMAEISLRTTVNQIEALLEKTPGSQDSVPSTQSPITEA